MKRRNRNHNNKKKEKIIMLMSSVFVLSALTVTGVYVREKNESNSDGYIVDLSEMNKQVEDKANDIGKSLNAEPLKEQALVPEIEDDLDYDPSYKEANSGQVEIPGVTNIAPASGTDDGEERSLEEESGAQGRAEGEESPEDDAQDGGEEVSQANSNVAQAISFSEKDSLQWPIAGNVLLNYSMDKTIYFPTLQQYKYNPAIVIEAQPGANITAAAAGKVVDVYYDSEIGHAVMMDLGNGYQLTYGQLDNIAVKAGDYVSSGAVIATVAEPTKYYSVEGCNVYFKLTKDGVPVNPLGRLS